MSPDRPRGTPSRADYLRTWSSLHGEVPTTGLVGWWLTFTYALARPLAVLRISPHLVTILGLDVAALAWPLAATGPAGRLFAALAVVASGVIDNLDGALAVLTRRVTRWGYVLDSLCDRLADACYGAALWAAGAPGGVCLAAVGLSWLQEYARARAGATGMTRIGGVTVAERPTRVLITAMFLVGAGLFPQRGSIWVWLGAFAWLAVGAIGLLQTLVILHRELTEPGERHLPVLSADAEDPDGTVDIRENGRTPSRDPVRGRDPAGDRDPVPGRRRPPRRGPST